LLEENPGESLYLHTLQFFFLYVSERALLKVSFLLLLGYLQRSKSIQLKLPPAKKKNNHTNKTQKTQQQKSHKNQGTGEKMSRGMEQSNDLNVQLKSVS